MNKSFVSKTQFSKTLFRLVSAAFLLIPLFLAISGTIAVGSLLLGKLQTIPVIGLSILASVVAGIYLYKNYSRIESFQPGSDKEKKAVTILAVLFVLTWVGFNSFYNSSHVYTNRDPAIYAVAGAWLVDHNSIDIPRLSELNKISGIKDTSAGFGINTHNNSELYAQGTHVLPAFLGITGRLVGKYRIYPLNVVFGGIALISLFAFTRMIVKPRWALAAIMILGAGLPLVYFSRDTYTEPLALAFTFGGLALMVGAYRLQKFGMWLLAGFTLGAGVLTRIDGYMTIIFVLPFLFLYIATSSRPERKRRTLEVIVFSLGVVSTALIGYLDTKYLSSGYFRDTWKLIKQEIFGIGLLAGMGVLLVFVAWKTDIVTRLDTRTRKWRSIALALLLALLFIGVMLRPLVYKEFQNRSFMQADGTSRVERVRNYKEGAVYWVVWYIGPLAMILGIGGLIVMTYRLSKGDKDLVYVLIVSLVIGTSLIYFLKPQIASDQIWASRRMLPVIMPGFIIAAVFLLQELYDNKLLLPKRLNLNQQSVISALTVSTIALPLFITFPFIDTAPFSQLTGVRGTCSTIPANSTIIWSGIARLEAPMSTRAFCKVPSVALAERNGETYLQKTKADQKILIQYSKLVKAQGRVPLIGIFDSNIDIELPGENNFSVVSDGSYVNPEYVRIGPPRKNTNYPRFIRLGIVDESGKISPILQK